MHVTARMNEREDGERREKGEGRRERRKGACDRERRIDEGGGGKEWRMSAGEQ